MPNVAETCLKFTVIKECITTNARVSTMALPHYVVNTPVFMPVGTQGTLKGLLPDQLEELDCEIILGNTYHLGTRPGHELIKKAGGLHKFMGWNRALLTDSGGFQMVSLLNLAEITETGVKFWSPFDNSECMLSPENSINIQNCIGADIIMQLDDVIKTTTIGPRVEEAAERTVRWLDRCIEAHKRPESQSIFPIVQGGLDTELREKCLNELVKRKTNGYAIGGLSGGEAKEDFWKIVLFCNLRLPKNKPRYLMGVGFAEDLVVCVALGVDMFDCVFPTRTARFGCGLTDAGQINLRNQSYKMDYRPIQDDCDCSTCKNYTRAYIYSIVTLDTVACHLLTVHNISYQMRLMKSMRKAIEEDRFSEFVKSFMANKYRDNNYPQWIVDSLSAVNINLLD